MELPYSVEVYFAQMADYNVRWFVGVISGLILAVVMLTILVFLPLQKTSRLSRLCGFYLGLAWVWIGVFHQIDMMAELNFMAPVYGVLWIAQGGLILWFCGINEKIKFQFKNNVTGRAGLFLCLVGITFYPAGLMIVGHDWMSLSFIGTAPEPTLIFTTGLLLLAHQKNVRFLFVIPACGAGVVGLSAWLLHHPLDYLVPASVCFALLCLLREHLTLPVSTNQNVRNG